MFYPLFIPVSLSVMPILQVLVHLSSPNPFAAQKCFSFEPTTHSASHKHTTFCLVIICVYLSLSLGIVFLLFRVCMLAWLLQSCLTLCDPMDYSPQGSSVHGILRGGGGVAVPFSRGSSLSRDWICISCIASRFFTHLGSPCLGQWFSKCGFQSHSIGIPITEDFLEMKILKLWELCSTVCVFIRPPCDSDECLRTICLGHLHFV